MKDTPNGQTQYLVDGEPVSPLSLLDALSDRPVVSGPAIPEKSVRKPVAAPLDCECGATHSFSIHQVLFSGPKYLYMAKCLGCGNHLVTAVVDYGASQEKLSAELIAKWNADIKPVAAQEPVVWKWEHIRNSDGELLDRGASLVKVEPTNNAFWDGKVSTVVTPCYDHAAACKRCEETELKYAAKRACLILADAHVTGLQTKIIELEAEIDRLKERVSNQASWLKNQFGTEDRIKALEAETVRLQAAWDSSFKQAMANGQKLAKAGAVIEAAKGLVFGEDWNNGTHAQIYRPKLIAAIAAYQKGEEA